MSEEGLDGEQIDASFEQRCREGMPQRVRMDALLQARPPSRALADLLDGAIGERRARLRALAEAVESLGFDGLSLYDVLNPSALEVWTALTGTQLPFQCASVILRYCARWRAITSARPVRRRY